MTMMIMMIIITFCALDILILEFLPCKWQLVWNMLIKIIIIIKKKTKSAIVTNVTIKQKTKSGIVTNVTIKQKTKNALVTNVTIKQKTKNALVTNVTNRKQRAR